MQFGLTCSAPIFLKGRLFTTVAVKRFMIALLGISALACLPQRFFLTHPTALSAKLRTYFFCSTRCFTSSATCLMEPTRSTTYADLPLTFSKFIHGVLSIAANAGSQAPSSSRCRTTKQAEITLSCEEKVSNCTQAPQDCVDVLPNKLLLLRLERNLVFECFIYRLFEAFFELKSRISPIPAHALAEI
jgi:hypothetical protein